MSAPALHGLLLTGGTSRRMGADKALQPVGGVPMGVRAGRALMQVADPVVAVGPDPGLGITEVSDPGEGPLVALVSGMRHLAENRLPGPVLLVACDLPFLTPELLGLIAGRLGDAGAAVPVDGGRLQPLAACYAPGTLPVAEDLVARGERSMRALIQRIEVVRVEPGAWSPVAGSGALMDVDTPGQLQSANLLSPGGAG